MSKKKILFYQKRKIKIKRKKVDGPRTNVTDGFSDAYNTVWMRGKDSEKCNGVKVCISIYTVDNQPTHSAQTASENSRGCLYIHSGTYNEQDADKARHYADV